MSVEPWSIIQKYIKPNSYAFSLYAVHSVLVAELAVKIGIQLGLSTTDQQFITEAALLHDIGIVRVRDAELGCTGDLPYICHGVEGAKILLSEGLPQHARVAERHTGVGITSAEIGQQQLPLPKRDLVPETLAEKIIAYADKFYSKTPAHLWQPYTVTEIEGNLRPYGEAKVTIFREWHQQFSAR
jgi:uncharacterized protein